MRSVCAVAALFLLASCATKQPEPQDPVTQCTDPRPQVCTMEYAPACAQLVAGGSKEYASACNACADDAVAAYVAGPCPE